MPYHPTILSDADKAKDLPFSSRDLSSFSSDVEAYHFLMLEIVILQKKSTCLIINNSTVKRIFVDGGFSKNVIYMNLLAEIFPEMEVFGASMAQATALGTALAIHDSWNEHPIPKDLIELKFYSINDL
jgi:glycerol kinase